ncbi:DUF6171 family protein [Exiguobacterium sp.]|uniref:DUF6171 family protein n=1 Tax=Exiguobacterium sp. TaxID=44751 RepID=UPI00344D030B
MSPTETRRCRTCPPHEADADAHWLLALDSDLMDQVTAAEYKARLQQCATCEFHQKDTCLKCGCFVSYRAKLATKHCPLNVW